MSTGRSGSVRSVSSGRPAEQPVAPRVVGEVAAAGRAVHPVAIERRRVVDEPEAVAVRRDVDDRQLGRAVLGERVRDADTRRPAIASSGTGTER